MNKVFAYLLALLFPQRLCCHHCGCLLTAEEELLCAPCRGALDRCKIKKKDAILHLHDAQVHSAAVYRYQDMAGELTRTLKYMSDQSVAQILAEGMADRFVMHQSLQLAEVCVGVPSHAERVRKRGCQQAQLLCETFSMITGLPDASAALRRVRGEKSLVGMDLQQRKKYVRGAFEIDPAYAGAINGRCVLLIDDVQTTGATVKECARMLYTAGARNVLALTVCRVMGSPEKTKAESSIVTLYFSGTGNSRYVAKLFAQNMEGDSYSIEETLDFEALLRQTKTVAFVYPVYMSRVPRIMREFVEKYQAALSGKKLIILCTQMGFSGDGARCFTDLLPRKSYQVLYAEHIQMPNNINNMNGIFKKQSEKRIRKLLGNASEKIEGICQNVRNGIVVKRGFSVGSRMLGLTQGLFTPSMERNMRRSVAISETCNGCGLCVRICPMHNLSLENGKAIAGENCTLCYRCMNQCPKQAIGLYFHGKIKWQYQGFPAEMKDDFAER